MGTAHISKASVQAVEYLANEIKPDTICVELCESRKQSIVDSDKWKNLDIFKVFKERKMYLLLSSLILSSFQKKMGKGEVKPGDELKKGIEMAHTVGARLVPVDREIQTTLKRSWAKVGFFSKMYLLSALFTSLLVKEDVSEEKIEEMKSEDVLKDLFSQLPKKFDEVKKVIIDERDEYLAEKIRQEAAKSQKLLAIVGAGHLEGIMKHIETPRDLAHLEEIPQGSFWDKASMFLLPVAILALMAYTFYAFGADAGTNLVLEWIIVKGTLSAIGALLALAHPISILLAFVIAPIGNFNPILKPGWMAALCESWLRKPLVEDFERISEDSEHFTGYWKNRVIRIFLVLLLPQIGSSIGTFVVTIQGIKNLFH